MPEAYAWYVGIDWGSAWHQVTLLDAERCVVNERTVAHRGEALAELVAWLLAQCGDPRQVAVAIEVPRGAVVETLLEHGFAVFAINPKQLDRFRDRFTVAGAKDDRRDALVLGTSLATDRAAFRRLRLDDPPVIRLRELSRLDDELQQEFGRLTNRLRDQVQRVYPQLLALSSAVDEPWIWELLELMLTPAAAALTRPAVAALLQRHRIRRVTADTVVATLSTPALWVAPGTREAVNEHLDSLLPRVRLVHEQRTRSGRRLEQVLESMTEERPGQRCEHRDVAILRSLPGVGRQVAATMLAEASQLLAERDYHGLRAQAGLAPVTRQSGKRRSVSMRYGCNPRLRQACYHWGRVSTQLDAASRGHYERLRQRGHSHGRAIRGVVDRLLAVLMAMLTHQATYDPRRRQAGVA